MRQIDRNERWIGNPTGDSSKVKNALSIVILIVALFSSILFFGSFNSCKNPTQPQPFDTIKFKLIVEDVSCTEAWLKLILSVDVSIRRVLIKRLTTIFLAGFACWNDTVGPTEQSSALTLEDLAATLSLIKNSRRL